MKVIVRAPSRLPSREIERILDQKADWISKAIGKFSMSKLTDDVAPPQKLSKSEIEALRERTRGIVTVKSEHFAKLIGVKYNRIAVKAQKTRWGSCSSKGNLNFNLLLALCPDEIIDYVVVHELCHLIELNHSQKFWNRVEQILPDYSARRKWLKANSSALISRLK